MLDQIVNFVYNSQKIEGGVLDYEQTKDLCLSNIYPMKFMNVQPDFKVRRDCIETLGQFNFMKDLMYNIHNYKIFKDDKRGSLELSLDDILSIHHYIFNNTKPTFAGQIRDFNVGISGDSKVRFTPYELIHYELDKFMNWYNKQIEKANIDTAFRTHYKFVKIHPFGDGNGRISRILMNYVLTGIGHDLFVIEYEKRMSYYNRLNKGEYEFVKWCKDEFYKK